MLLNRQQKLAPLQCSLVHLRRKQLQSKCQQVQLTTKNQRMLLAIR